ncbi:hypothetical protein CJ469_06452 [Nocardia farcinica]|nr:hypothetical protein CJ469_06452 [Nocardia farcinica]
MLHPDEVGDPDPGETSDEGADDAFDGLAHAIVR